MEHDPKWKATFRARICWIGYRYEDLALALAAQDGAKYTYTVIIEGQYVTAVLSVDELYPEKSQDPVPKHWKGLGAAEIRWFCVKVEGDHNSAKPYSTLPR
ncbi:hypothetical protein HYFRA_00004020 [Hymenoscyphus fraxineus]|uniref:Uncharacterized protein n=1 Tax=Hymenoscyphus fraxineus TaxID=746836 RepID=A0A9N9PPR1_9HELO|nr:hypothetical protein HYFRA_00004020 [Hymenoscyphus fraxineus]